MGHWRQTANAKGVKLLPFQESVNAEKVTVGWSLTALSARTGYIMPQAYKMYCVGLGTNTQ